MIKTLVIAPYPGMVELMKKYRLEQSDLDIDIEVGDLEKGLEIAKRSEELGYDVIISRGGTASLIQQHISIPVVHIDVTGYDMIRVLTLIKGMEDKAALVGFPNICQGAATLCSILDLHIKTISINSGSEVKEHLLQLKSEGYSVIIGDVVTVQAAEQIGMQGILITSGKESIMEAFEEAKRIYALFSSIRKESNLLLQTLHQLPYPIALINHDYKIQECNDRFKREIEVDPLLQDTSISGLLKRILQEGVSDSITTKIGNKIITVHGFLVGDTDNCAVLVFQRSHFGSNSEEAIFVKTNIPHTPLVGSSEFVQSTKKSIHSLTTSNRPVLIIGEPGTGKETLTETIHAERYGSNSPMVIANCDQVTEHDLDNLLESSTLQETTFTLVLKNIHLIRPTLQQHLLTTIKRIPTKASIISISEIRMGDQIEKKQFSHDLYYQLAELTIRIPPLKNRKGDIDALVQSFITELHTTFGKETVGIRSDALEKLKTYDWPGNINQLRQAIGELTFHSQGIFIEVTEVERLLSEYQRDDDVKKEEPVIPLHGTLEDMEQLIIQKVLDQEGNNQSKAAERLGINRSTLWRKLNK
ncbi:PrpR N-terminal domain-containing protein [Aquibacillus sp. 3ASR75-11]|uniref:PrpR N-terminal domain-containing protein n=1 Tax=Terrihalobacillus insolitus TaxID=2950438 RepID=A0A9X3WWH8_9BACI|nr:sigma-54-dependent transcriptional regulator [Terrihalobacillus insolitus]MDC3425838.1 PrpR N-terminal domain-containing protein [Terrihalobacillus insolitus]